MLLFLLGIFASLNRSSAAGSGQTPQNGDRAAEEPAGIVDVSVDEAYALIQAHQDDPDFVVLDLRTPPEYAAGHLPSAELLNFYDPRFIQEIQQLDRNKTYLYYCATGNRSSSVTEIMQHLGFKKAYHVYQGITTWSMRGLPIE
ncbi:MAG: rhodanese-like domain-containing protein [candidate division KSB1 bacterium]|nr:rhodanese-like domain-containing protein [candidate division KSB1 bacterium]